MTVNAWKVGVEHGVRRGIVLAEQHGAIARLMQADLDPADPREQPGHGELVGAGGVGARRHGREVSEMDRTDIEAQSWFDRTLANASTMTTARSVKRWSRRSAAEVTSFACPTSTTDGHFTDPTGRRRVD